MNEKRSGEACRYYQRQRLTVDDMTCPVASPSPLFLSLVKGLGVVRELPGNDEWELEYFLDEMNRRISEMLGPFNASCLVNGIPMMNLNVYTDGEEYYIKIRWGATFYPSMSNCSAAFHWLLDFMFGHILKEDMEQSDATTMIVQLSRKEFADFEIKKIEQLMAEISEVGNQSITVEVTE